MIYVLCKKDVVMDYTREVAFNKGKKYDICRYDYMLEAVNNKGEHHGIGHYRDPWLHEHFEIVEED